MADLVIDIGNSRVKIALFEKDRLVQMEVFDEFAHELTSSLLEGYQPPHRAIVSNVRHQIPQISTKGFQTFLYLNHQTPLPIKIAYKSPDSLGNDRLAIAVAAHELYRGKNVLVIGMGTTLTYDVIEGGGIYVGGAISPGLRMRFQALHKFTGRLPLIEPGMDKHLPGRNTSESIQTGVYGGILAEVDDFINKLKMKYPGLIVVLTGGDVTFFDKNIKNNIFAVPNLVIEGLKKILDFNASE